MPEKGLLTLPVTTLLRSLWKRKEPRRADGSHAESKSYVAGTVTSTWPWLHLSQPPHRVGEIIRLHYGWGSRAFKASQPEAHGATSARCCSELPAELPQRKGWGSCGGRASSPRLTAGTRHAVLPLRDKTRALARGQLAPPSPCSEWELPTYLEVKRQPPKKAHTGPRCPKPREIQLAEKNWLNFFSFDFDGIRIEAFDHVYVTFIQPVPDWRMVIWYTPTNYS